jgi:CRP-like cAMP-binding protein
MKNDPLPVMLQLSVFEGFTRPELDVLSSVFRIRQLKPGEVLGREGSVAPSFFVLASGIVSVLKELEGGKRQRLATVGKNSLIGQLELIDGGKRAATYEAASPVVLLECTREDFERLFRANNPFAYKVLDFVIMDLSKRLRQANKRLEDLLADPGKTLGMMYDAFVEVGKAVHETGEFSRLGVR